MAKKNKPVAEIPEIEIPEIQLPDIAGFDDGDQEEPMGADAMQEAPKEDLSAVLDGFKERSKRENQRFLDATDSEYWVALCFQTREQKEEFLAKLKLLDLGDKYIDGMEAAKVMGVKLTSRIPEMPKHRPFDREYVDIALDTK
jgi:hypothetical protein